MNTQNRAIPNRHKKQHNCPLAQVCQHVDQSATHKCVNMCTSQPHGDILLSSQEEPLIEQHISLPDVTVSERSHTGTAPAMDPTK